ncbi:heterokaryon incompatibility protein-domain-containing protein [Bisporella sp. PMI_857]|nr:heterokaryon incompatibility protein-domain-containing protein [Bisporella sp. PMI_857]
MESSQNSKILCGICNSIFAKGSYKWWRKWHHERRASKQAPGEVSTLPQHHVSYESLLDSVGRGCWICVQLEEKLHESDHEWLNARGFNALGYCLEDISQNEDYLQFILSISGSGKLLSVYINRLQPKSRLHRLLGGVAAQISTADEDIFELARCWLAQCHEGHFSCFRHSEVDWLPTRLLDVSKDLICLRNSSNDKLKGSYATLSHCWGNEEFWMLSKETMPKLLEGVPLATFSRTFQDAISTVRRLSIDYIWIDCFCILQGADAEARADWDFEASRMGQVYMNSFINIGASHASGPEYGLFSSTQSTIDMDSKVVAIVWDAIEDGEQTFSMSAHRQKLSDSFELLDQSPLMRRSWVLQESVLSPRMLSFNGSEVLWQCSEAVASANFPDIQKDLSAVYWAERFPFWSLVEPSDLLSAHVKQELHMRKTARVLPRNSKWIIRKRRCSLMQSYCQASLTFPDKDIFKALDGIGQRLAQLTNEKYYRGFSSKSFPQSLLWLPGPSSGQALPAPVHLARRSPPHRAPSWHWASFEGPIDFSTEMMLYQSSEWGDSSFSPLAYVFMSSDCEPFALSDATNLWPSLMCIGRLLILAHQRSYLKEETRNANMRDSFFILSSGTSVEARVDELFEADDSLDGFALLPLIFERWDTLELGYGDLNALLVRSTSRGTFRRVGVFSGEMRPFIEDIRQATARLIVLE